MDFERQLVQASRSDSGSLGPARMTTHREEEGLPAATSSALGRSSTKGNVASGQDEGGTVKDTVARGGQKSCAYVILATSVQCDVHPAFNTMGLYSLTSSRPRNNNLKETTVPETKRTIVLNLVN